MELNELKKSWNVLDNQTDQHPLVSEEEMKRLIAAGKTDTRQKLGHLNLWQRTSLYVGIVMLCLIIPICLWTPDWMADGENSRQRIICLLAFLAISAIAGLIWDWKTYRWLQSIQVDRMSVVEVSRRMITFRRCMRNEVIGACFWVVIFNAINFWVMGYHQAPPATQVLVIALLAAADILIIYILYKKVMFKYFNDIRKNIEELKDICTE